VDLTTLGIAIISFTVIACTKIDPTFVILGGAILGAMAY
jgi:hypothetical protein